MNRHKGGVTGLPGFWPWAWLTAFRFGWKQDRGLLDAAGWAAKVMLIFLACIVAAFGYGLWFHNHHAGAYKAHYTALQACLAANGGNELQENIPAPCLPDWGWIQAHLDWQG